MARKKLYYPVNDIQLGLYTSGNEFALTDGTEYVGQYHRYISTNEYYTGAEWSKKTSKQLIALQSEIPDVVKLYKKINPNIKTNFKTPVAVPVKITKTNLDRGYVRRFIFEKINDKQLIESDQINYEAWQRSEIDNNIYNAISVKWYITGELEDTQTNGVITKGILTKNRRIYQELLKTNPEVAEYLSDPLQFYADTSIVIPRDINGLDS